MTTILVPVPYKPVETAPPVKLLMLSGVMIKHPVPEASEVVPSTRRNRYFISRQGKRYVR
jgi:hypothetical protein